MGILVSDALYVEYGIEIIDEEYDGILVVMFSKEQRIVNTALYSHLCIYREIYRERQRLIYN